MAENGYTSLILGADGQPFRRSDVSERPPLRDIQGQPLYGEDGFLLPHQRTFSAVYNAISRTYRWYFDEALKHNQDNALAMRRDVAILEMLRERQLPVAQLKWHIEPEEPKDEFQKSLAEDLEKILLKTPRFQQLRMSLLEAEWYGRYGVQLAWRWYDDHGRRVMRIADWRPVNGDKIQYDYDGVPGVHIQASEAIEYPQEYVRYGDRTPLLMLVPPHWRSKFIIHRHEIDDADYFEPELAGGVHGVGIRHRIYWLWWMRNEVLTWALDFLERIGAGGLTVFYYDASSPEAKTEAQKAAMEYDRNTALAWPRYSGGKETGSMIERIEPGSGNGEFVLAIVKYFDDAMRRYVVGQNLSSQAESTGLGSKLSELHGDTKFRILKWDAENLDETLTCDLVKVAQYWNYQGNADFEMRFMSSMDKPNPEKQLEAVQTATSIGVRFREDEVRELTGLSKPEDDDEMVGGEATLGMDEQNQFGEGDEEAGHGGAQEGEQEEQRQGRPFHRKGQPLRYDRLASLERNMELLAELIDRSIEPQTDEERDRRMDRVVWPEYQPRRYEFREEEHPRGQPQNAGEFAEKPGGGSKKKAPTIKPIPTNLAGRVAYHLGSSSETLRVKPTKQRAFVGEPVKLKTQLSKQESGAIGEAVLVAWLKSQGFVDARPMNLDRSNFPIDLIQDHETIEAKTGMVSNAKDAQKWRLTFNAKGTKEEEAWRKTATPEQIEAWGKAKQAAIHQRKEQAMKELSKKLGKKVKGRTLTCLLNPDTKTVDIYSFDGFKDIIRWNSEEAKQAYVGSVTYG